MLRDAKTRAKEYDVPFTITLDDIVIPERCPVLGVRLYRGQGRHPHSPSLDRLVPGMGYVPGNVIVVSRHANIIKSDATPSQIRAVADFYDNQLRNIDI